MGDRGSGISGSTHDPGVNCRQVPLGRAPEFVFREEAEMQDLPLLSRAVSRWKPLSLPQEGGLQADHSRRQPTGWRGTLATLALLCHVCLAIFARAASTEDVREDRASVESASPDAYREFALGNPGDPSAGAQVFQRQTTACSRCHSVDGTEKRVGPGLQSVGDKFPRAQMIQAVLEPSASIAVGYATHVILTRDGTSHTGVLWSRPPDFAELVGVDGERVVIPAKEIVLEKGGGSSLMPTGIQAGLTKQDFVDLIAYLGTLHQAEPDPETRRAMPDKVTALEKPVRFEAFNDVSTNFHFPVWIEPVPGTENSFVVLEHNPSKIWMLEKRDGEDRKTLFLDLEGTVLNGPFWGLMGMTFHPRFTENRIYYLDYQIDESGTVSIVVDERRSSPDGLRDSGETPRRLLKIDQRGRDHHGGQLLFGEDGYLYVGTGDGGPQEDPQGQGQNLQHLSAAILRIDVDQRDPGLPYAIPATNPFHAHPDLTVRREIWAYGIRQAWRFSFDPLTRDLWLGDVGQASYEEVSIVRSGENHGWNIHEGFALHSDKHRQVNQVYVPPVFAYPRKLGTSVTGGYVYRGQGNSSYQGVYIFGDYQSKRVWGLTQKDRKLSRVREIGLAPDRVSSFGLDRDGGLFVVGYDHGVIYKIRLEDSLFE